MDIVGHHSFVTLFWTSLFYSRSICPFILYQIDTQFIVQFTCFLIKKSPHFTHSHPIHIIHITSFSKHSSDSIAIWIVQN
jgi:hypothetical protein